jgi:hypothetical protein
MDKDFIKRKYADSWEDSSYRELRVADRIIKDTGKAVKLCGFGAGKTGFLTGSAADHGFEKNFPDLAIEETNIFVEVTGPLKGRVEPLDPLWIRVGKVDFAYNHYNGEMDIWLVHHIFKGDLSRVIHFDNRFLDAFASGEFRFIWPRVRGIKTKFIEIDANHFTVEPWERLPRYIKNRFPYIENWRK